MTTMSTRTTETQQCVDACVECRLMCRSTLDYCLRQGGVMMNPDLMRVLLDCDDMSGLTADLVIRGSGGVADICRICADMCARCADMCAVMPDDAQLMKCSAACRKAAAACRVLISATA
jgi:hypothetical protein